MGPREVAARTDYVRRSRTRTIQSLRRTAGMLERVIDQNRLLAENPDHRRSSLVRIAEGKVTPTEPVAGPAAEGSITPPPVAIVRVVGPAVLKRQLPVTVAETESVWVVLAAGRS